MNKLFKNFIGVLQLNLFNSINENNLFSIEELRAYCSTQQKIEIGKKYRKYIKEINKKNKKWLDKKNIYQLIKILFNL